MPRLVIALFFSFFFSVQMLPVEQVAAFLYASRITEEIPHGQDEPHAKESESASKFLFHQGLYRNPLEGCLSYMTNYLRIQDERINTRCADDVSTPPPDIIC